MYQNREAFIIFCTLRMTPPNSYCQSGLLSYSSSLLLVVYLVDVVFHPFCFQFFVCKYTIYYSLPNNFTSFFEKQQKKQEDEYTKKHYLSSTRRNNLKSFRFVARESILLFQNCLYSSFIENPIHAHPLFHSAGTAQV